MDQSNSRRGFLQECVSAVMMLAGGILLSAGCQSRETEPDRKAPPVNNTDPCNDYSDLSDKDLKAREALGYVKKSPVSDKHCGNCKLWLPPAPDKTCGKCQLFKGPVPEIAYCTYWAPQE